MANEERFQELDRIRGNIRRGVDANKALNFGDEGRPMIDNDLLQYAIYKRNTWEPEQAKQQEPNTVPADLDISNVNSNMDVAAAQNVINNMPEADGNIPETDKIDYEAIAKAAHETNAYRKFMGNTEDILLEAKRLKEESGVNENAFLGDEDSMALLRESIDFNKKTIIDPEKAFKENPALARLVEQGKELEAAIAANNLKDVQAQKSIIDLWQDAMKFDDLQMELSNMGKVEMAGGKRIDENRVQEIQKEMQAMNLPGMAESPFQTVVGGTFRQLPQMGRGALTAIKRALAGAGIGAGVGAAAGTATLPVVGTVGGAAGGAMTGAAWGARVGWFEGSYDEMVGANYVSLRSERNEDGSFKYTPEQANTIATAQALVSAGIESANVGGILGRIGGARSIMAREVKDIVAKAGTLESMKLALTSWLKSATKDAAKTTVEESLEEAAQSVSDDLIKSAFGLKYGTGTVSAGEIANNAIENFTEAVPASMGFGIGQMGFSAVPAVRRLARMAQIRTDEQRMNYRTSAGNAMLAQLKEQFVNSELFKKDNGVAADVLKENLQGSGFETVYIDSKSLLEQENGEALLRDAAQKAGISEDMVERVLAGEEDINIPTEVYFQTELSNNEKANTVITFSEDAICFARQDKEYKLAIQEYQDLVKSEIEEAKRTEDVIVNNTFAEGDRAAAKQLIADHGWNPVAEINKTIKKLQGEVTDILNEWSPQWYTIERDEGVNYYIPGKGYGHYYNQYEKEDVPESFLGSDVQGELKAYEWIPSKEIVPGWYQRYMESGAPALNAKERTSPGKRQLARDAIFGNDKYGIYDDDFGSNDGSALNSPEILEARQQIEGKEAKIEQLKRLAEGFKSVEKDADVIARGLSSEGYQVYKAVYEQLKNSPTAESREAALFNAIVFARHADRFAETMRAAGNENYTALDYLNKRVQIDAEGIKAPDGGFKQAVTNSEINVNTKVPAIVIKGESAFDNIDKAQILEALIKIAQDSVPIPFGDMGLKIDLPKNSNTKLRHLVYGNSGRRSAKKGSINAKILGHTVENLKDILDGAALIEIKENIKRDVKGNVDSYYKFFVPLQIDTENGARIFTVSITAELSDNNLVADPGSLSLFEVKKVGNPRTIAVEAIGSRQSSLEISILEMLKGVNDVEGIPYINTDGTLHYAWEEYHQDKNNTANGQIAFSNGTAIISLFKTANRSTFIHETGHLALQDLKELAEMENAPEQIKKDWETLKQWLDYKDDQTKFTVEQQEKFARGFEAYLRSGEAPAPGLKRVFRQFKSWLCQLYKDVTALGGEPSPEVKAVMARMLATQDEVDMAARLSAHNLFMRNKAFNNVSDAIKAQMEKWMQAATEDAQEKVMAMAMKDMQENYPEQRKIEEQNARETIEAEIDSNDTIALYNLIQDAPEAKEMWLEAANVTEEQYEKSLADLGGSREAAIQKQLEQHMKEYDEGYASAANIKAKAEEAIANGEYSDKMYELEMAYLESMAENADADNTVAEVEQSVLSLFEPDANEKKIDELVKKIDKLNSQIKRTRQRDQETINKLKALQKEALAAQKAELEYKLQMQEWNDSIKLIDLRNEKNEQILELRENQEAEIAALKDKSAEKVEAVKARYDKKLEALKEKYEKQAYKLWWKTTLDAQEKQQEAEYKAWWKGAADAINRASKTEAKKDKEIERLEHKRKEAVYNEIWKAAEADYFTKRDLAAQKQKFQERMQALKEEKNAKIAEVREGYKEKLKNAINAFKEYRKETTAGLRALRDAGKGFTKMWRETAKNTVREEALNTYYKSEGKFKRESKIANSKANGLMVKGQWAEAAAEKRSALINAIFADEARKLKAEHDRLVKAITKKGKSFMQTKRQAPANSKYAVNYIMWACGWSKELMEAPEGYTGFETVLQDLKDNYMEPEFDERWLQDNGLPSWLNQIAREGNNFDYLNSLNVEQLKELRDFMNLLCKNPLDIRVTDADGFKYKVEDAVADMIEETNERMNSINDGTAKVHQERTTMQNVAKYARELRMNLLNMDNVTRQMGEKVHSLIYDRINNAVMKKMVMQKDVTARFKKLVDSTIRESKDFLEAKYDFNGEQITGKELLSIALNCGNKTNRLRIVEGFGVHEGQILKVLKNLGDREWAFVQGVWDLYGEIYPQVKEVQYRTVGSAAKTVTADPFTIVGKDGKTREIKGGYYEIVYDKEQSVRAKEIEQMNAAKASGNLNMALSTGMGITKGRAKSVKGMPLTTNLNVIANTLNKQINIITMREAVMDVKRIMNNSDFQDLVKQQYGMDMLNYMQQWLADQWLPAARENNQISRAMRWARVNSTIGILGLRLSTIVTNFANVLNVMMYIGPGNTMSALKSFYSPDMINHYKNIMEKSAFIRERLTSKDRDIRDALASNIDFDKSSKFNDYVDKVREMAFVPIAMTDFMFALPLWKAEYERVYREADTKMLNQEQIEAKAVREADASVRRMFGSGLDHDLVGFQKTGEAGKLWTMFYSYFSVIYNAVDYKVFEGRMAKKQGQNWTKQAAPMIAGLMYMVIGQSIMDACIREFFGLLGDDDDALDRIVEKSGKNVVDNAVGAIPGIRDAVPYLIDGIMGDRQNDFRLPAWTLVVQMGKVQKAAADPGKDMYDLAYETSKLAGLMTGLPQTGLDAVPTTLKFFGDGEKYDLWDYIKAVARDKKLK